MDRVAIDHGAQPSVAHGQRLFKERSRTVIMQDEVALLGPAGRYKQQEGEESFHHSTGLFSIGQPVRVETTGMRI